MEVYKALDELRKQEPELYNRIAKVCTPIRLVKLKKESKTKNLFQAIHEAFDLSQEVKC